MSADPEHSVPYIKQQLKPATPLETGRVRLLLIQLDDSQYKLREQAIAELRQMGDQVVPHLDKALTANPPLEVRRRLELLRNHFMSLPFSGERLRLVRAVEVLERIGNTPARQVLQALSLGPAGALETVQAQAALKRLEN
jgi:hypothetical protein